MKKVIIEIPDVMYDWIDNGFPDEDDYAKLWELIRQGTPLPKGHGDLIDRDKLIDEHAYCAFDYDLEPDENFVVDLTDVKEAQTIIKADKGE